LIQPSNFEIDVASCFPC